MGGGLRELITYGSQDVYLTGKPDVTFFKTVYRKHANFAMESIEQQMDKNGREGYVTISKDGDLITNMWIECENEENGEINKTGHEMIEKVELLIGGKVIDTHYGEWYNIWSKLTMTDKKLSGYEELVNARRERKKAYIPLQFFFCKTEGVGGISSLPIIALRYQEVSIRILFSEGVTNEKMFVNSVYLEQNERERYAQEEHKLLIEQLQYSGEKMEDNGRKFLKFKNPCKELIWRYKGEEGNEASKKGGGITIKLNEYDKVTDREDMYFTHIQPYQHHTNIPGKGIYVYSFALKPEEYQPTGTCNFSRLKTSQIISKKGRGIEVYTINYNVLVIKQGMAGLLY